MGEINPLRAEKPDESVHVRICPENEAAAYYAGQTAGYRQAIFDASILLVSVLAGFFLVRFFAVSE